MAKKTFINPFFFQPTTEPIHTSAVPEVCKTLHDKLQVTSPSVPEMRHDCFANQTYSGRIVCKLTTATECVFGNRHYKVEHLSKTLNRVENFSLEGQAAIASTTLKGMFSTLAEMASGSAMRVLKNRLLSIRSRMTQSKSAIGMIIEREVRGSKATSRYVLPLSLPTFSRGEPEEKLKAKTDAWNAIRKKRSDLDLDTRLTSAYVKRAPRRSNYSFHLDFQICSIPSNQYAEIHWDGAVPAASQPSGKHINSRGVLRPYKHCHVENELPTLGHCSSEHETFIPGILRRLRPLAVENDGKKTSTFDQFIPIPIQWITDDGKFNFSAVDDRLLHPAESACAEFELITTSVFSSVSDSPTCTELDGQPAFNKVKNSEETPRRLQQGDLVCFSPGPILVPEKNPTVESVSISGIWRESPRWMWNPKDYTPDLVDSPERLPMNKKRKLVTLAEKMFGWVDDTSQESEARQAEQTVPLPAYKGRVTFSHAISTKSLAEVELVHQDAQAKAKRYDFAPVEFRGYFALKILASPKPPCPEFYLTGARTAKEIRNEFPKKENAIKIRGWKYYVLSQRVMNSGASHPWMTADPGDQETLKQKNWVKPIRRGTDFYFHVDFENLTEVELQLLCYTLYPDKEAKFVHRCGMGKPLQLGGVKVQPIAISYLDRQSRCSHTTGLLSSARYASIVPSVRDCEPAIRKWQELHTQRASKWRTTCQMDADDVFALSQKYMEQWGEAGHRRFLKMSVPIVYADDTCVGISYPLNGDLNSESRIFDWFVNNRENNGIIGEALPDHAEGNGIEAKIIYRISVSARWRNKRDIQDCIYELVRNNDYRIAFTTKTGVGNTDIDLVPLGQQEDPNIDACLRKVRQHLGLQ